MSVLLLPQIKPPVARADIHDIAESLGSSGSDGAEPPRLIKCQVIPVKSVRDDHYLSSAHVDRGRAVVRRMFNVIGVMEILPHRRTGRNISEIARGLDVDRKTVQRCVETSSTLTKASDTEPGLHGPSKRGKLSRKARTPGRLLDSSNSHRISVAN
jgi:hypothetical protein